MAEWEEKLNTILSDPQAMGKIAALAQALQGPAQDSAQAGQDPAPQPPDQTAGDRPDPEAPSDPEVGEDPEAWRSAPESGQDPGPLDGLGALGALGDLDPRLLQTALGLLSAYSADDDRKTALLTALKPFLKPERWAKVDQAIRIARLSRVIRTAFRLFKPNGQEEDGHV